MASAETVRLVPPPQHYLWWFPGSPVKVHLALGVVQRLQQRLSNSGVSNSEEGLLFGGTGDGATEILDFQPAIDSGVASMLGGLSPAKRKSLVGYYRVEEAEAFQLNARDIALAKECFAKPYNVFLIIHCNRFGPPTATFFFHDRDCRMADFAYLEFPFDPSLLAAEQHDRMQRSQQALIALPSPVPVSSAAGEVRRAKPRVFLKALGSACALASIFTLGMWFSNGSLRDRYSHLWRASSNLPSGNGSTLSASPSPSRPSLSLRATRRDTDLELTWNRDSALIAAATSGTLSIQDGQSTRSVSLDAAQLRDGSLLYFPRTDQILMRLTVTTPTTTATESVIAILPGGGQPQTYLVPPSKAPSGAEAISPAQPRGVLRVKSSRAFAAPSMARDISPPAASVLPDPPALNVGASALANVPDVVGRLLNSPPSLPARPPLQLQLPLQLPPPLPSVSTYEPPVALVKTQPVLPLNVRSLIVSRTIVEVAVTIDKNGKVTKAEAIPQANIGKYFLNSATAAALSWKFKPARSNHEPVSSESILQFVFNR